MTKFLPMRKTIGAVVETYEPVHTEESGDNDDPLFTRDSAHAWIRTNPVASDQTLRR